MLYLVLSILSSTAIILIFKLFPRFQIQSLQAIVFNYITCLVCGWIALGEFPISKETIQVSWLPYALTLGLIFIFTFNIAANTVKYFGATIAAVMQRMSLVVSVPFAIIAYQEPLPILKIIGLLAALLSIIFINMPDKKEKMTADTQRHTLLWTLPLLFWLASGVIEIIMLYVERDTSGKATLLFTTFIFTTAAFLGSLYIIFNLITRQATLQWRNLVAGICLGIPNFGSVYFLLKSLSAGWHGSVVFPINNVTIIGLSALLAWLLFSEKLSKINILGVLLAILAILLIAVAT
ncbi:MAG: hypothetical protein SFU99_13180 [Saprospiraceae bacterium]|nr:hypothetical protein [Saprospiraceae bacterium]